MSHCGEISDPAIVDPVPDLLGAELGLLSLEPGFLQRASNLILREADELNLVVGARLRGPRHRQRVDGAGNRHDGGVGTHGRPPI